MQNSIKCYWIKPWKRMEAKLGDIYIYISQLIFYW